MSKNKGLAKKLFFGALIVTGIAAGVLGDHIRTKGEEYYTRNSQSELDEETADYSIKRGRTFGYEGSVLSAIGAMGLGYSIFSSRKKNSSNYSGRI